MTNRQKVDPLSKFRETLGDYYKKKREFYQVDPPRTYVAICFACFPAIRNIVTPRRGFVHQAQPRAGTRTVAKWTGEYQLTFDAVLEDMIARCRKLKLRAVGPERELRWSLRSC